MRVCVGGEGILAVCCCRCSKEGYILEHLYETEGSCCVLLMLMLTLSIDKAQQLQHPQHQQHHQKKGGALCVCAQKQHVV